MPEVLGLRFVFSMRCLCSMEFTYCLCSNKKNTHIHLFNVRTIRARGKDFSASNGTTDLNLVRFSLVRPMQRWTLK